MAYQTGDAILDDHYNGFVANDTNNINRITGTGTDEFGYGTGNVATVDTSTTVQASQWTALLAKLEIAKSHQDSTINISSFAVSSGDVIAAIANVATDIGTVTTNKHNVKADGLTANAYTTKTFTGSWKVNTIYEYKLAFAGGDEARFFFNAGGSITSAIGLSGHTSDDKANEWKDLLETLIGTFTFDHTTCAFSGSGTANTHTNTKGYYDLTTSYVTHLKMFADSSPYTDNFAQLEIKGSAVHGDGRDNHGAEIFFKWTLSDAAADQADAGQDPQDALDAAVTNLDIVNGNLAFSGNYNQPDATHLGSVPSGSVTYTSITETQS